MNKNYDDDYVDDDYVFVLVIIGLILACVLTGFVILNIVGFAFPNLWQQLKAIFPPSERRRMIYDPLLFIPLGESENPNFAFELGLFFICLIIGIIVIAPISALTFAVKKRIAHRRC